MKFSYIQNSIKMTTTNLIAKHMKNVEIPSETIRSVAASLEGNIDGMIDGVVSGLATKYGFDKEEANKYLKNLIELKWGRSDNIKMADMTSEETNDITDSSNAGNVVGSNPVQIQMNNESTDTENTNGPADQEQNNVWTSQRTSNDILGHANVNDVEEHPLVNRPIEIDILWDHITKGNIHNIEERIKYLLQEYGTSLPCNRFDIGNSIEFIIGDYIKSLGFTVIQEPNAKRIDLQINHSTFSCNSCKLSIKYSSTGDITLHNSNSCMNKDETMTDLILLTPTDLYLITNNNIKEVGIHLNDFLVNKGDSLKLKRSLITKLKINKDFKYKCSLDIEIVKSNCHNKSCAEVFYQKAMEDFNKLQIK
tara:strand:- start:16 stop:1110 length:1095 start_codon:yes stop_codon:yes gene_type:complete